MGVVAVEMIDMLFYFLPSWTKIVVPVVVGVAAIVIVAVAVAEAVNDRRY